MNLGTNKLVLYSKGIRYRLVMSGQALHSKYVTYYIDSGSTRNVEYDEGANVLSPNFTPSKHGWTFVGWREDTTASTDVLTSKTMGTENMKLYAVYNKTVTLSYYDGYSTSPSAGTKTGTAVFNAAGNFDDADFTMSQASYSGWTTRGWATSSTANV